MSRLLTAAFALALTASAAHAAPEKRGDLKVVQPWSRPAQAGMNGVGFFTLVNGGKTPVTLKAVESPAAGKVEMHTSSMANGVMSMRSLDQGVTIPAGGQVVFAPGGHHLMLLGLKQSQAVGQKVPVTLVFDKGRKVQAALEVQLSAPPAGQAMPGHAH